MLTATQLKKGCIQFVLYLILLCYLCSLKKYNQRTGEHTNGIIEDPFVEDHI